MRIPTLLLLGESGSSFYDYPFLMFSELFPNSFRTIFRKN